MSQLRSGARRSRAPRIELEVLGEAEGGQQRQKVLGHHAAHHAARGEAHASASVPATKTSLTIRQVDLSGVRLLRALLHRLRKAREELCLKP